MAPTEETGQAGPQAPPYGPTPPTRPPAAGAAGPHARMPRWLPRALVLALSLYAVFQLGSWAFHQLTGLLINILIAFFLALAIEPAVSWMAARGMRRGLATALVFLAVLVAAAGFVTLLGSMLAGQIVKMVEDFPEYLDSVINWINTHFHTELRRVDIQEGLLRSDWLRNYVQNSATGVLDVSAQVLGGLFQLLTILLFSFYFAADGPRLRRALCSFLPPARQAEVLRAWEIAVNKTGGYLYSRGLMALVSGLAHYVLLEILQVPYAPALAVWVGLVSQFIPTIGTYLAGALPMLIAFTVDPWYALWVLGFVVVYQQFENYVLQPKLTSKTVDIHPAVAFGSVVAGPPSSAPSARSSPSRPWPRCRRSWGRTSSGTTSRTTPGSTVTASADGAAWRSRGCAPAGSGPGGHLAPGGGSWPPEDTWPGGFLAPGGPRPPEGSWLLGGAAWRA